VSGAIAAAPALTARPPAAISIGSPLAVSRMTAAWRTVSRVTTHGLVKRNPRAPNQ